MNRFRAVLSVIAGSGMVLAAACSPEAEAPPTPVTEPTAAPAVAPAAPPLGYACESGQTVTVSYPDTATAQLSYRNQSYVLRLSPAATGARYSGTGLEWWTANHEGQETATLSRLGPNQDVGVAVLERCSRPSNSTVPTGPTPLPGGVMPVGAPCRGPQLKLSAEGGDAGAGNRVSIIGVQNIGAQPCSLTGYPTVALMDARGRGLTTMRSDQDPGAYFRAGQTPTPVTLQPQAKAFFDLAHNVVPNQTQGERVCPAAARIRFTAPGDTSPVTLDQAFTPCGGRIRVSPIRAAAEPAAGQPATAVTPVPAPRTSL